MEREAVTARVVEQEAAARAPGQRTPLRRISTRKPPRSRRPSFKGSSACSACSACKRPPRALPALRFLRELAFGLIEVRSQRGIRPKLREERRRAGPGDERHPAALV